MYLVFVLLFILQLFSGHFCRLEHSFNEFSNEFTSENFQTALIEFQDHLLSSDLNYNCNISITLGFYLDKGFINARCYNENQNRTTGLHFHMITTYHGNRISYDGKAYHVCLHHHSCDRTFVNDWIPWQIHAINNTIKAEKEIHNDDNFNFVKFQLWSFLKHSESDLCFYIFADQNENFNAYLDDTESNTRSNVRMHPIVDDTVICLRCRYDHKNIISNLSALIIKLSDLVVRPVALKNKKVAVEQGSTTLFYDITHSLDRCKSSLPDRNHTIPEDETTDPGHGKKHKHFPKWLIFLIILLIILAILLVLCIVFFIMRRKKKNKGEPVPTKPPEPEE